MLEMLAHILALLAGLASRFAAGTLPAPLPQAPRPTPARAGLEAAYAPSPGRERNGMVYDEDQCSPQIPAMGTFTPNQMAPVTMRASGPNGPVPSARQPYLGFHPDRRPPRRNGCRETAFSHA